MNNFKSILIQSKKLFLSVSFSLLFTSNSYAIEKINFSNEIKVSEKTPTLINIGEKEEEKNKNPFLSAGLSFLIPGAGQVYNEEYLKGALLFVGVLGLAALDFFVIEPQAKIYEQENLKLEDSKKKSNSLFELGALATRISLPTLWVYNWGSAYQSADPEYQKKLKEEEKKKNQQNTQTTNNIFSIRLVKISF